jgi:signal transduction histidine kinase
MPWMTKSLFRRLLFSYLITVLLGLGVAGFTMSAFTKDYIYQATQDELLRKAKKVNLAIQNTPVIDAKSIGLLEFLDQSFDARIWVFDRSGKIIATSTKDEVFGGKSFAASVVQQVLAGHDVTSDVKAEGLSKPMMSLAVPWGKEDTIFGGIVMSAPVEGINNTFGVLRETILWATLFGILLSTAMVSYLSWTISRPLKKIDRAAIEIGMGNYSRRVQIETADEFGDLANTINTLADKLDKIETDRNRIEQVRVEFLANISHELRTPLTSIQGFLEAMQDGLVDSEEARQRYYQVMYQETMHLNRLVDDLMDLVKLENREVDLFKTPVDLAEVSGKAAFSFRQEAEEKNTTIEVLIPEDLPKVHADKHRLAQIFKNLLHNAVKFTDNGTIRISAAQENEWIKIQVKDTGIGIAKDDLERIWERFFKGDRIRSRTNKGTGLGLAIVRELVVLHEGKIAVESEAGHGTVFTIWLPVGPRHSRINQ